MSQQNFHGKHKVVRIDKRWSGTTVVWFQVETQPFVVLLGITSEIPDFVTPCDKGATEIALKQFVSKSSASKIHKQCLHPYISHLCD